MDMLPHLCKTKRCICQPVHAVLSSTACRTQKMVLTVSMLPTEPLERGDLDLIAAFKHPAVMAKAASDRGESRLCELASQFSELSWLVVDKKKKKKARLQAGVSTQSSTNTLHTLTQFNHDHTPKISPFRNLSSLRSIFLDC